MERRSLTGETKSSRPVFMSRRLVSHSACAAGEARRAKGGSPPDTATASSRQESPAFGDAGSRSTAVSSSHGQTSGLHPVVVPQATRAEPRPPRVAVSGGRWRAHLRVRRRPRTEHGHGLRHVVAALLGTCPCAVGRAAAAAAGDRCRAACGDTREAHVPSPGRGRTHRGAKAVKDPIALQGRAAPARCRAYPSAITAMGSHKGVFCLCRRVRGFTLVLRKCMLLCKHRRRPPRLRRKGSGPASARRRPEAWLLFHWCAAGRLAGPDEPARTYFRPTKRNGFRGAFFT